jgi:O-acetyl-ADP-ribose deacetylase (regulator of RNase III)
VIEYVDGDIFDAPPEAWITIPVNTVGVLGKGLAKQFAERYPDEADAYRDECRAGRLPVGTVMWCLAHDRIILWFPTKQHWRDPSRLEWIEAGLVSLASFIREDPIEAIAIPMLGCGLGGLDWADVRPLIERYLGPIEARVLVYGPGPEES